MGFDEYTTPSKAIEKINDFDYVTLDFMYERTETSKTTPEPAAAKELDIEEPQSFESFARLENAKKRRV